MRVVLLLLICLSALSCRREPQIRVEEGTALGTTWRLLQNRTSSSNKADLVRKVLATQEGRFSNWKPRSEVSRLERGEGEPSSEMRALLELAGEICEQSGGAFDVSWDGGLDLAGIAKGWAVDQVAESLEEAGVSDFIFELGGEVVARGDQPGGSGWPVVIEKARPGVRGLQVARRLTLYNEALATSGNYHQPTHLKDGRNGETIDSNWRSVTVVMPTCAEADAWATALFVLAEEPDSFSGRVYRH